MPTLPPPDVEETPDFDGAYPRLSPQQIESLGHHGERRAVKAGDVLFSEGDERYDFHVVLEGKVAIIQAWGEPDERLIAVHGPGRFLGELSLLTGQPAFFTAVVVWHGEVLRNPGNAQLAACLGLPDPTTPTEVCDLLVVGAGPAGLAAAVYGASEGLETITLDRVATGGQAATSSRIENYLGFPAGISGAELAERATLQARKFGARVTVPAEARRLEPHAGHFDVHLEDGDVVAARTLVIATGAQYRRLPVPRLEELEGNGIYYAATLMEAQMCTGDPVAVVGGGNSAGQATLFLAKHAAQVTLIVRSHDLRTDMSDYLAARIERLPSVQVLLHHEVRELLGERRLEGVVVEDLDTAERRTLEVRDLFVFIGADPHTDWLDGHVALDDKGFVLTGPDAGADMVLETSLPGVLAVGDVRSGSIKRVASAVGEGSMAVRLVHEHLAHRDHADTRVPQRA